MSMEKSAKNLSEKVTSASSSGRDMENPDYVRRLVEARENIERDVIILGIKKLNEFLKNIEQKEGSLPSIIIFLETSGRPLAYAVKPLIKKVYEDKNVHLPNIRFCKIFTPTGKDRKLEEVSDLMVNLPQKLKKIKAKRSAAIQQYRMLRGGKRRNDVGENLSMNIQKMTQEIRNIEDFLSEQEEQKKFLTAEKYNEIIQKRVAEILSEQPKGAILVIDDVAATGATLMRVSEAVHAADSERQVFFFTFLRQSGNIRELPANYESGVSGYPPEIWENSEDIDNMTREQFINYIAWSDLFFEGFRYRATKNKKERLGVKKDILSKSLYSERVQESDRDAMRALRKEFSDIGTEALLKI